MINIAKPVSVFKNLCANKINKAKCPKTPFEKTSCKSKNREKFFRKVEVEVPKMNVKEFVEQRCEKRKNLVEICIKKARMMAQRKADRNAKEYYNYFM